MAVVGVNCAHNERGEGEGKERKAPMHLIETSKFTHTARVTKSKSGSGHMYNCTLACIFAISRAEKLTVNPPLGVSLSTRECPSELVGHSYCRSKVTPEG